MIQGRLQLYRARRGEPLYIHGRARSVEGAQRTDHPGVAVLIQQVLEQRRGRRLSVRSGDRDNLNVARRISKPFGGGNGERIWRSFLIEEYGDLIAKTGGIGIADAVERQLLRAQEASEP